MCSQADDPTQHVSDDTLRAALDVMAREWEADAARRFADKGRKYDPTNLVAAGIQEAHAQDIRAALAASATDEPTKLPIYCTGGCDVCRDYAEQLGVPLIVGSPDYHRAASATDTRDRD